MLSLLLLLGTTKNYEGNCQKIVHLHPIFCLKLGSEGDMRANYNHAISKKK